MLLSADQTFIVFNFSSLSDTCSTCLQIQPIFTSQYNFKMETSTWKRLSEKELNDHLNLRNAESRSLQTFFENVCEVLYFTVEVGKHKNVVILRQTGPLDWWNRLNPKVSIGCEKIGKLDGEPRLQRISVECASLSGLRQALQDVREARIKSKFVNKTVKHAAASIDPWDIGSAIVVLQTLRCNLRVRGSFTRWCEADMKHEEGFKVDAPVCLSAKVPLNVDGTSLFVNIDDGLMLRLSEVGRLSRAFMTVPLLCARSECLILRKNGKVDEINSEWDVSVISLQLPDEVVFSVSPVHVYLH